MDFDRIGSAGGSLHLSPIGRARTTAGLYRAESPAPECRRRLEPPPSFAQRFFDRDPIAGVPAGHRADRELKRRPVLLPDRIEQDAGARDVARAPQTGL